MHPRTALRSHHRAKHAHALSADAQPSTTRLGATIHARELNQPHALSHAGRNRQPVSPLTSPHTRPPPAPEQQSPNHTLIRTRIRTSTIKQALHKHTAHTPPLNQRINTQPPHTGLNCFNHTRSSKILHHPRCIYLCSQLQASPQDASTITGFAATQQEEGAFSAGSHATELCHKACQRAHNPYKTTQT